MPKINWNDKEAVTKILVSKYQIPHGEIKLRYRQQLVNEMTLKEVRCEIEKLTGEQVESVDETELRSSLSSIVCSKSKSKYVSHHIL